MKLRRVYTVTIFAGSKPGTNILTTGMRRARDDSKSAALLFPTTFSKRFITRMRNGYSASFILPCRKRRASEFSHSSHLYSRLRRVAYHAHAKLLTSAISVARKGAAQPALCHTRGSKARRSAGCHHEQRGV